MGEISILREYVPVLLDVSPKNTLITSRCDILHSPERRMAWNECKRCETFIVGTVQWSPCHAKARFTFCKAVWFSGNFPRRFPYTIHFPCIVHNEHRERTGEQCPQSSHGARCIWTTLAGTVCKYSSQCLTPIFLISTVASSVIRNRIPIVVYPLLWYLDNLQHHLWWHLEIANLSDSLDFPVRDNLLCLQLCDIYRVLGTLPWQRNGSWARPRRHSRGGSITSDAHRTQRTNRGIPRGLARRTVLWRLWEHGSNRCFRASSKCARKCWFLDTCLPCKLFSNSVPQSCMVFLHSCF